MAEQTGAPSSDKDLADRAMGAIDTLVDTLRDKVVRPILLIGRTIAFSFIIVACVGVIAIAGCIVLLRFLDVYAFAAHQWASWVLLGVLFVAAGLVAWRYRKAPGKPGVAK